MIQLKENIVAVIPVRGRHPLLKHTIKRLLHVNGCRDVVCVGDSQDDMIVCRKAGAKWAHHQNMPLGAKWNAGFEAAKQLRPDAVLFVGSSDWLVPGYLAKAVTLLEPLTMVGTLGCKIYHFDHLKEGAEAIDWHGYDQSKEGRHGETIGIGRLLDRRLMDQMQWKPFDPTLDNSMDYSMMKKMEKVGGRQVVMQAPEGGMSLSISCTWWYNKHSITTQSIVQNSTRISPRSVVNQYPELTDIFGQHAVKSY